MKDPSSWSATFVGLSDRKADFVEIDEEEDVVVIGFEGLSERPKNVIVRFEGVEIMSLSDVSQDVTEFVTNSGRAVWEGSTMSFVANIDELESVLSEEKKYGNPRI